MTLNYMENVRTAADHLRHMNYTTLNEHLLRQHFPLSATLGKCFLLDQDLVVVDKLFPCGLMPRWPFLSKITHLISRLSRRALRLFQSRLSD